MMRQLLRSRFLIPAALLSLTILLVVIPGKALGIPYDTLFLHTDDNDPTTEGWTESAGSPTPASLLPSVGALNPDAGFGLDAWFVDDNSQVNGSSLVYVQTPTDAQIAQGMAFGWKLSWRLRVVDAPDASNGVDLEYADGAKRYNITFEADSSGNPTVLLASGNESGGIFVGGLSYQVTGSGYHLYELVFDPTAGSADLFIDGVERLSDYSGHTFGAGPSLKRVFWGAGGSITEGQGNWNLVEFAVATPEPATLLLLGSGLVGLGLVRRRRQNM